MPNEGSLTGQGGAEALNPAGSVSSPQILAGPTIKQQLIAANDKRFQRWTFYFFLMAFSTGFFGLFFFVMCTAAMRTLAWSARTSPVDAAKELAALGAALSAFPPSSTAILGAVIASVVAIPLSLSIALGKMVKEEADAGLAETASFTSALFELGKAFGQGWKAGK